MSENTINLQTENKKDFISNSSDDTLETGVTERLRSINVTKSIGFSCKVEENMHLGHVAGLLRVANSAGNTKKEVKILLDDSCYTAKTNKNEPSKNVERLQRVIKTFLCNCNVPNHVFFRSTVLRNNSEYIGDFYKLISVTPELDALECIGKKSDIRMADLLLPILKLLDYKYLTVDNVVCNNKKYIKLVKNNTDINNIYNCSSGFVFNDLIYASNDTLMSSNDKKTAIWINDTEKVISKKINKFFCEEGNIDCKLFEIYRHIVFPFCSYFNEVCEIEILGLDKAYKCTDISEITNLFLNKIVHPSDLKKKL